MIEDRFDLVVRDRRAGRHYEVARERLDGEADVTSLPVLLDLRDLHVDRVCDWKEGPALLPGSYAGVEHVRGGLAVRVAGHGLGKPDPVQ